MDACHIEEALFRYYNFRRAYMYQLVRAYVFQWESDFWCLNKANYCYEIEIKISRGDFFHDFTKDKHSLFTNTAARQSVKMPNKFLFAVPEGMVTVDEVPDYAGLVYIREDKRRKPRVKKQPKFIHKRKYDYTPLLLDKYYWGYLNNFKQTQHGQFDFPWKQKMVRTR